MTSCLKKNVLFKSNEEMEKIILTCFCFILCFWPFKHLDVCFIIDTDYVLV